MINVRSMPIHICPRRFFMLFTLFLFASQGACSLDERKVWIEGHPYLFEGNGIRQAVPLAALNRWDLHEDIGLERYVYSYQGKPALLHVWWEIWQGTSRQATHATTLRLVDFRHADRDVTASGCIVGSWRTLSTGRGSAVRLVAQGSSNLPNPPASDSSSGTVLPIEDGVLFGGPGVSAWRAFEMGRTIMVRSWECYYPDHESSKRPDGERRFTSSFLPEKGKTMAILKIRFVPLPPEELTQVEHLRSKNGLGGIARAVFA